MKSKRYFPAEEYEARLARVRASMDERELDACLVSAPENIYYLTGLDHQGYFAYQLLVVPLEGDPILITRAMERAIVHDQVPNVRHVGYSDGVDPLPRPTQREEDLLFAQPTDEGHVLGLEPWSASLGVSTATANLEPPSVEAAVQTTCKAIGETGLSAATIGFEQNSSFLTLPHRFGNRPGTSERPLARRFGSCRRRSHHPVAAGARVYASGGARLRFHDAGRSRSGRRRRPEE